MKDTAKQLSRRLGISMDTIRHYRETGIIRPETGENGYNYYGVHDMVRILVTREMRSMDISLMDADCFFRKRGIREFNDFLRLREQDLLSQMNLLRLQLERIHETRDYAQCGLTLHGRVEEFDGPPTIAVSAIGTEHPYEKGEILRPWLDHLPFTYISATIAQTELETCLDGGAFRVTVGAGALEKYVREFSLPVPDFANYQPGGHFIRTCITVHDLLNVSREDLRLLYDYRDAHGLRFAGCSGGRVLFCEDREDGPMYHLLVWIPVRKRDEKCGIP